MPDLKKTIAEQLKESAAVLTSTAKLAPEIEAVAQDLLRCYRAGGKLLTFGNGGSSCDAQNFADELVGRYRRNRPPLSALALTVNQGDLTSIANDFGYEEVFARQLRAHGRKGDVAVAISTSGNSKNVLKAIEAAHELGITVVGLTGRTGGKMKALCDHCIGIPSDSTARIQEAHITVIQIWCGILEDELFPRRPARPRLIVKTSTSKILPLKKLLTLRELWRWEGRQVVFTNGVFDILHAGHVKVLEKAKAQGDLLVVGVNADASVRRLEKAPGRPINAWRDRAEVVAALGCVDAVVGFSETTPERLMSRLKPDVHVKGGDYKPASLPEAKHAGRVAIVPLKKGYSTTALIRRLQGRR